MVLTLSPKFDTPTKPNEEVDLTKTTIVEDDDESAEIIDDTISESPTTTATVSTAPSQKQSQASQKAETPRLTPEETVIVKRVETPSTTLKPALKRRISDTKQDKDEKNYDDHDRDQWFCPQMKPPLENDSLEHCLKKSNETIVSYFKTGEKYKMVAIKSFSFREREKQKFLYY